MVVVSGWVESDCETEFGRSKLVKERGVSTTGLRREWEGHACWDRASTNMNTCYEQRLLVRLLCIGSEWRDFGPKHHMGVALQLTDPIPAAGGAHAFLWRTWVVRLRA